jgi:hypothetical protein
MEFIVKIIQPYLDNLFAFSSELSRMRLCGGKTFFSSTVFHLDSRLIYDIKQHHKKGNI